jgi:predicted amidohydrolase YtcJ
MSINPIDTIYAAVTRSDFEGNPPEGYYRNNALTLGEALQSHTQGSAYIEGFENRIGTLEEGKLADIVVLDCNPFELDIMDLRKASVAMTIFNGKLVYEKN